ncbi:Na+/H+ antiporter subunit E [Clostridium sp. DL1XJH146]
MKNKLNSFIIILLITIFWIILNEELSLFNIIIGLLLGGFVIFVTNKFYINNNFSTNKTLNILFLVKFYFYLIYKIILSGLKLIPVIISGKENIKIVDIYTSLENKLNITLLSNAITLTPGTITVEQNGNHLKVLWINCTTENSAKAGEIIKGDFERFIKRGGV